MNRDWYRSLARKKISSYHRIINYWYFDVTAIIGIAFWCIIIFAATELGAGEGWAVTLVTIFGLALVWSLIMIGRQPHSTLQLSFKVRIAAITRFLTFFVVTCIIVLRVKGTEVSDFLIRMSHFSCQRTFESCG